MAKILAKNSIRQQYLCDTQMPRDIKVAVYINWVEVCNQRTLVTSSKLPKVWKMDLILKDVGQAKTLKSAKQNFEDN